MTARILVVDDVPANVRLLEARLSAEYFDVTTATGGADALAKCERAECDLVLLDVMMPNMDGFEVCRRLKKNPVTQHIPVVMVTALDQVGDRVAGLDAGADDFLTKPVSDLVLIARVRSLARLKMMTDELRMRAVTSKEIGLENPAREAVTAAAVTSSSLTTARPPTTAWPRRSPPSIPWTSRPSRGRRCSRSPTTPTTSPSYRSGSRTMTVCGCAATSARWSAPATCRCSPSPRPTTTPS
jgi:CheY-like chemotaxis protein